MAFAFSAALALSTAAFAETVFTGTLVAPAGTTARAGSAPVAIHIDHYTEDAEVQRLQGILQQKGPNALRDALWDQEAGYIRIGGSLGYPIAAARSHKTPDGGTIVRLMIDRPIAQYEVINNLRTVDYPFAFVEIKLDRNGKGDGQFYQAAKVSMTGNDQLNVENYSPQPLKLLAVHMR
ncbi:MAG: hypothetical protein ACJ76N_11775 [Thermoanaerobaculia bacterium]